MCRIKLEFRNRKETAVHNILLIDKTVDTSTTTVSWSQSTDLTIGAMSGKTLTVSLAMNRRTDSTGPKFQYIQS